MGQLEFGQQSLQGNRFFDGVEILALDVLNQRYGNRGLVGHVLDDAGHHLEPGQLGRAPAPLTCDDLEAILPDGAYHYRLNHALRPYRVGQVFQRILGHVLARLVFAGLQPLQRQLAQLALVGGRHGLFGTLVAHHLFLAGGRAGAEQGIQPLAQPTFLRRHMLSRSAVIG